LKQRLLQSEAIFKKQTVKKVHFKIEIIKNLIFKAMKRVLSAVLLLVAFSSASFSREFVAGGKTYSAFGDYKIELANNPVTINGEQLKAYIISYQNSPMEVKVVIRKDKNCKNYIVLSDKLSVQYVCNGEYFGVQRLDKSFEKDGYETSDQALNRSAYFHQKLIAPGKQSELENTQLIAAYFPMLIKDELVAVK
jgi:hypothetical protein